MNFIKNSLGTFITLVLVAILGITWSMITARVLEPQGVGVLAIAMLYPVFYFTIGHMTFHIGTIYKLGRRKYPIGNFAANSLLVSLSMGILLYIIFVVTLPLFQNTLYKGIDTKYLYIAFIMMPCYLVMYLLSSVLQGIGRIKDYNIINLIRSGSAILCLIILIVVLRFGVTGAVVAFVIGYLVAALAAIIYVSKQIKGKWQLNFKLLKDTLIDGGKIHIASIATFIYGQVGLIVVNYYLSPTEVGYLFIALTCVGFLTLIPLAIQTVLYTEAAMSTEKDTELASARACRHTVFWVAIGAIVLALLSNFIISFLAGESFMPSALLLLVLLPGAVVVTVAQVMSALWIRKGWLWFMAASGVVIGIVGILLQLFFVPRYGIIGSAIASSLTYLVGFLIIAGVHFLRVDRRIWHLFIMQTDDFKVYGRLINRVREFVHV